MVQWHRFASNLDGHQREHDGQCWSRSHADFTALPANQQASVKLIKAEHANYAGGKLKRIHEEM